MGRRSAARPAQVRAGEGISQGPHGQRLPLVVCFHLQPDALDCKHPDPSDLAMYRRLIDRAREVARVIHVRLAAGDDSGAHLVGLEPADGETIHLHEADAPSLSASGLRECLNDLDPACVYILGSSRGDRVVEFALALSNMGFSVNLLAETLCSERDADPAFLARVAAISHPRLTICLAPVECLGPKPRDEIANDD